jgi:hypothetical protein
MLIASRAYIRTVLQDTLVALQGFSSKKVFFMKEGRLTVIRDLEIYEMLEPATVQNYSEAFQDPGQDGSLSRKAKIDRV